VKAVNRWSSITVPTMCCHHIEPQGASCQDSAARCTRPPTGRHPAMTVVPAVDQALTARHYRVLFVDSRLRPPDTGSERVLESTLIRPLH